MATISLLRACGGARQLFLRSNVIQKSLSGHIQNEATKKVFTTSSASSTLEYFRARRGPFTPEEKQHGHSMLASTHWKVERVVAVAMLPLLPACIYIQGPISDLILSVTVLAHGHWGVSAILTDYIEKFFPPIHYFWLVISALGFAGLLHFNYNDVGVSKAISMVWSL